jgi:Flp pilus assembly protein TadD
MGACYRQLGDGAAAGVAFRQAIELAQNQLSVSNDDAWIRAYLASFHASLGEFEPARAYADEATAAAPDDPDVRYFDAVVEALAGGPDVQPALERALAAGYPSRLLDVDPLFN